MVLTKIREMLCHLVRDELAVTVDKGSKERIPNELVVQYVVGAYMAVMTWWLDSGATLRPQHIDAMFQHLAFEGVASVRQPISAVARPATMHRS